jgi:hypothetical protein
MREGSLAVRASRKWKQLGRKWRWLVIAVAAGVFSFYAAFGLITIADELKYVSLRGWSLVTRGCNPPEKLICTYHDLSDRDLANLDFAGGKFQRANFSGSDLSGVDLSLADLTEADLTGVKLTGANLSRANLNKAQFLNAILEDTNLEGASTAGTNFPRTESDSSGSTSNSNSSIRKKSAVRLACQDGLPLDYCSIRWSNGSYSRIPWGVGLRQGGIVDSIRYLGLDGTDSCILLYADGSIMTTYDLNRCG